MAIDANRYPVPLDWVGAVKVVEVHILGEELWIHRPGVDPVRHGRLLGKHQTARWNGPARQVPRRPATGPDGRASGCGSATPYRRAAAGFALYLDGFLRVTFPHF